MRLIFSTALFVAVLWASALAAPGSPRVDHVFIVSIDGGKPAVMAQSDMPVLKRLVAEGACTWTATTIFPSLTLPSHTSMLTGVGPDKHRVSWNTWKPGKGVVRVPTVFAEAKKAGLSTAMFVGKEKFRHLLQPGTVDEFRFKSQLPDMAVGAEPVNPKATKPSTVPAWIVARQAAGYIVEARPSLCFIHFTDPDDAGHKYGWGSPQQIWAFSDVDGALAEILDAIDSAGIGDSSVLLITADHGGHARTHGSRRLEDMNIPWIAWGRAVKRNFTLTSQVTTYDTAATALWLLSVPLPAAFDGRPVLEAFASTADQIAPTPSYSGAKNLTFH